MRFGDTTADSSTTIREVAGRSQVPEHCTTDGGRDFAYLLRFALFSGRSGDLERRATTEEEALAALEPFLADAAAMFTLGTDPLAAITALFGSECAADVIEAGAAVVVELEAEAAATGGL